MKYGAANYLMGGRVLGVFLQPQRLRSGADGTRGEPDVTCNALLGLLSADELHDRSHAGMVSALRNFSLKFTK